jgi:hypothetical protein
MLGWKIGLEIVAIHPDSEGTRRCPTFSVIPGRAKREPGMHNHNREYEFRACASKSAVADLDNDTAELG